MFLCRFCCGSRDTENSKVLSLSLIISKNICWPFFHFFWVCSHPCPVTVPVTLCLWPQLLYTPFTLPQLGTSTKWLRLKWVISLFCCAELKPILTVPFNSIIEHPHIPLFNCLLKMFLFFSSLLCDIGSCSCQKLGVLEASTIFSIHATTLASFLANIFLVYVLHILTSAPTPI